MVSFSRTHYPISLRPFFARGAYRQEGPTGQRGLLARGAYWPQGEALAPVASPLATPLVTGYKTKVVSFLRVQISTNGKMCFVVPVSHLKKQALARDISHEPPKRETNSGTTLTAVASYPINESSISSCWLSCDQSPHCLDYLDHACLRYLRPEA